MPTILTVFGVLGAVFLLLIAVLMRRGSSQTENTDGLRIEQSRREQARADRSSFSSFAVHNAPFYNGDRNRK
ncbi:hypothetical protein [Streptomyces varsoviensis]|uniref:Uncharacterized protein n=1 Tax=Streptomyces varsoviensis TaxID=67373 RepID=A0ABR5ISC7_9ACTN|nr:hypothetical protein [Streptomyces varsoviensis]KOG52006.1 hypothetical protein ADK38_44395 [Streptomyces varsoviensis]